MEDQFQNKIIADEFLNLASALVPNSYSEKK
jgi:hypothetical protein